MQTGMAGRDATDVQPPSPPRVLQKVGGGQSMSSSKTHQRETAGASGVSSLTASKQRALTGASWWVCKGRWTSVFFALLWRTAVREGWWADQPHGYAEERQRAPRALKLACFCMCRLARLRCFFAKSVCRFLHEGTERRTGLWGREGQGASDANMRKQRRRRL